ncbi:MAG TPA: ATP-binding protein [Phycisphaerae bacterium]|nr:ATP-binding protein [Phycisphaerae bacterium]
MAKRRGISISLAAKCQLLFGLAVLVIIAGALAVPWQRMEQLATQPNIKAARLAADIVFRQAHAVGGWSAATRAAGTSPATGPASASATEAATATSKPAAPTVLPVTEGWNNASLQVGNYGRPRILVPESPTTGLAYHGVYDELAAKALHRFRDRPLEIELGEMLTTKEKNGETLRTYRYAAALRAEESCIACHTEFAAYMPAGAASNPRPASETRPAAAGLAQSSGGPVVGVIRVDVPYQTDENQLLLNRIVIVVAGMLGGALAIVVFYLITSRLILQPVRVLKNTAEKVSGGDLNIRSAISTGDEFQHLSETFNTMLANLQASREQLEASNRSLDTRVGELAQSNVDLFEANRLKSEFLTNVTHELRTPLNAIIGFADLMAETAKDPKQQRYSENIRTSAKQLLDLINDLLDLAKIEAGKLVLRHEKVNVADVCEAMANFMRPLAQKKDISLEMSVAPDMPLITTDPGRFQQILYNFLSNAIKFTPNAGRVTITTRMEREAHVVAAAAPGAEARPAPAAGAIRIAIADTGPGIPAEDQQAIFEKFRQLDGSVTRQHSGSGLGLAISRELASMLGARIELVSAAGKGATFSLIIPLESPEQAVETHSMLENR